MPSSALTPNLKPLPPPPCIVAQLWSRGHPKGSDLWTGSWGARLSASSPRRARGTGERTCMYHILSNSCAVRAWGAPWGLPPTSPPPMPGSE